MPHRLTESSINMEYQHIKTTQFKLWWWFQALGYDKNDSNADLNNLKILFMNNLMCSLTNHVHVVLNMLFIWIGYHGINWLWILIRWHVVLNVIQVSKLKIGNMKYESEICTRNHASVKWWSLFFPHLIDCDEKHCWFT